MGALSGLVIFFALCDALFIAAFLMIARLLFAGNASLASAATMWTMVCFPLIFVGYYISRWDKKRVEKDGKSYQSTPGDQLGNMTIWCFISLIGDILNIFAMSRGMPLTLGSVIGRGVKAVTVGLGSRFIFLERISRPQAIAVGIGLIAALMTLALAYATDGTLFDKVARGKLLGIPIWVFFCVAASTFMGAKDIQARRVLDRLPLGTTMFWGSGLAAGIGSIVVLLCHTVLGDWELAQGYPDGFWTYGPVAALCLVISVPFRHAIKRMKGNLFLVSEFVAGVILLLMVPFDFLTKEGKWENSTEMYIRLAIFCLIVALSLSSSLFLYWVSKIKRAESVSEEAS